MSRFYVPPKALTASDVARSLSEALSKEFHASVAITIDQGASGCVTWATDVRPVDANKTIRETSNE